MPLPMVHLSVAVKVLKEPSPSILLGSLSPDAIHMRENSTRDDKTRTHLYISKPEYNPLEIIRNLLSAHECHPDLDFTKGYCIHLLTDYIWLDLVYSPFLKSLPKLITKQQISKLYYLETDQIDFNLYNKVEWRLSIWNLLALSKVEDFESLLKAEEIERWRDRVLHWYGELMQEPKITPTHITDSIIDSFVNEAVRFIQRCFIDWNIV